MLSDGLLDEYMKKILNDTPDFNSIKNNQTFNI